MKNQFIVITIASLFLASCNEAKEDEINVENLRSGVAESQAINEKLDRQKNNSDFFASEKYKETKEESQCIDNSNGDFRVMTNCTNQAILNIKDKIQQKITQINNSKYTKKWLAKEYKKIENKCNKEISEFEKDDTEDGSDERLSHIAVCVSDDLYQFGRKLK